MTDKESCWTPPSLGSLTLEALSECVEGGGGGGGGSGYLTLEALSGGGGVCGLDTLHWRLSVSV